MVETQNTPKQDDAEVAILQVKCVPSLKEGLRAKFREAGFSSLSDGIRTLARDLVAGRFHYKGGVLQSQAQIT